MIRPFIILGATLIVMTACGVKGNLQPKGQPEPMPAPRLMLSQQGSQILLDWEIPTSNQDGTALTDLAGFRIDQYAYLPDRYCQECRDQETIATIHVDNPAPAVMLDRSIFFRTEPLADDYGYRYRVRPFTRSGKSGPATEARRLVLPPPPAPTGLRAEVLDRGVRLFWALPETVQETGDLLGINIYRGNPESTLNPIPVNPEPVSGNNFDDFGLENDTTYQYGLRTVVRSKQLIIESESGQVIEVTPRAGL